MIPPRVRLEDKAPENTGTHVPDLGDLAAQFDALFEQMQTPEHRAGIEKAFKASPAEPGRAAVEMAAAERTAKKADRADCNTGLADLRPKAGRRPPD